MPRIGFIRIVLGAWILLPLVVQGQERSSMREAVALEQAVQDVIRQAEPSIACILVTTNQIYAEKGDKPPADKPGQLGSVDMAKLRQEMQPLNNRRGGRRGGMGGFGGAMGPRGAWGQNQSNEEDLKKYDLGDPAYVPESFGSGVVIDGKEMLILTQYHVVRDATKVYVRLPGGKGSYADIHAGDPRSDLAVLKLIDSQLPNLPEIKFGDASKVRKGQFVITLANPYAAGFRDGSPSASFGVISNIRQRLPKQSDQEAQALYVYGTLLQTDARLNLGCSGGALLNLKGEMIGLTTSRAALTGMEAPSGFAMPIDANIRRVIDKLKEGKEVEYGFLGVTFQPHPNGGVELRNVTPGSPAQRANLQIGDVVLAVDNNPVQDTDDLYLLIGTKMVGGRVQLKVRGSHSGGQDQNVQVTLTKADNPGKIIASKRPDAIHGMRVDYTSAYYHQKNKPQQFNRFHWSPTQIPPGVWVTEVEEGSRAAKALIKPDDVILKVNGEPVNSPAEFYKEMAKVSQSSPVEFTFLENGDRRNPSSESKKIMP